MSNSGDDIFFVLFFAFLMYMVLSDVESASPFAHANSMLLKYVHNCKILWDEYASGLDVQNLAREFTRENRRQNKCLYCNHKFFWNVVEKLILRGYTSDTEIDHIYLIFRMKNSTICF